MSAQRFRFACIFKGNESNSGCSGRTQSVVPFLESTTFAALINRPLRFNDCKSSARIVKRGPGERRGPGPCARDERRRAGNAISAGRCVEREPNEVELIFRRSTIAFSRERPNKTPVKSRIYSRW